jgi:hypothetical protein
MSPSKKKEYADPFAVSREENGNDDDQVSDVILRAMQKKPEPAVTPTNAFGIPRVERKPKVEKIKKKDTHSSGPKVSYRCFPKELKMALNRVADELRVPVGYLAYFIFEDGLYEYSEERLTFTSTLSPNGYTMYPEEQRKNGKPAKGSSAPAQLVVTFHGIPADIDAQIQEIANRIQTPKGEVARRLIEFGLERHRKPKTKITAQLLTDFLKSRLSR